MDATQLTKFERRTLKTIIIIQIVHTVFWILIRTPDEFVRVVLSPGERRYEMVPLIDALRSGILLTLLLALFAEIAILRAIYKRRYWVWSLLFILLFDASLYIAWHLQYHFPIIDYVGLPILLTIPIGFIALWRCRGAHSITGKHWLQLSCSLSLAVLIYYFDSLYFRHEPQWGAVPPLYFRIISCSRFGNYQESSLILCWGAYTFVSAFVWLGAKIKSRQT
jgi:hypothetical protein